MLQVQGFLKLEEVKIKAEEEPKGEVIVGSSREALRPPGTGNTCHPDKLPLSFSVLGQQAPLVVFLLEALLVVR